MALPAFTWNGSTGQKATPGSVKRYEEIAAALAAKTGAAKTLGEGLGKVGDALVYNSANSKAEAGAAEGAASRQAVIDALLANPDPSTGDIVGAMSNEWVSSDPGSSAVVQALLAQEQQQAGWAREDSDPLRQLQLQQAQSELDAPLTINGQLVDRNSHEVLGDYRNPDDINATGNETFFGNPVPYQDAEGNIQFGQIGNKGTFKPIDLGDGGGQFVSPTKTVNTETEQIVMDQFGNVLSRMPIQNQQAAFDTAVGKGMGENQVQNVTGAPQAIANADTLMSQIDGVLNDPALDQAIGLGGILPAIPNTDQAGVVTKVEQLQGQAFLQAFESLKGGGQITEVEGKKATDAIARLNRVQNKEDFIAALKELRDIVAAAQARAAEKGGVTLPQSQATPGVAPSIDDLLEKYGTQ